MECVSGSTLALTSNLEFETVFSFHYRKQALR
jgi:hypothetical protein